MHYLGNNGEVGLRQDRSLGKPRLHGRRREELYQTAVTQMTPTVTGRLWESVGSQLHWFQALMGTCQGDFGPLLVEEGQKESSTQCSTMEEPGGHTCCVCFKVPATCCLWSGAALLSLSPQGQGLKPGPAWAPTEGKLEDAVLSRGCGALLCSEDDRNE